VLHVRTDRTANRALHRELGAAVAAALSVPGDASADAAPVATGE
jgi:hypothetical protein